MRHIADRTLRLVRDFHHAFGQPVEDEPSMPHHNRAQEMDLEDMARRMDMLSDDLMSMAKHHDGHLSFLRLQLCQEELAELAVGLLNQDPVECLDALCDMRYVADGAALSLGLAPVFNPAFEEVHRSNMSKLDEDGEPVLSPAGRVMKPPTYMPPELGQFVTGGDVTLTGHLDWPQPVPHRAWLRRPIILSLKLAGLALLGVAALALLS